MVKGASLSSVAETRSRMRAAITFAVCLGGLMLVDLLVRDSSWFLVAAGAVGVTGGAVASRAGRIWLAWLAVLVFVPLSLVSGWTTLVGRLLALGVVVQLGLVLLFVTMGFVAGTWIGRRVGAWSALRSDWRQLGRSRRLLVVGAVVLLVLGHGRYTAVAAEVGGDAWLSAGVAKDCRTPAFAYGWTYEAVNYDIADDALLAPIQEPDGSWTCPSQGKVAGTEVVTADGVNIAGWYIPAGNGTDPTGPTLVIVPGGKSNKSGMLKYTPPFHEDFNLVLLDDRGMGRSGAGQFSLGLHETRDVRAIVDWLAFTKHPRWIGAVGDSMGAATALAAAVEDQRIRALVLDSMHAQATVAAGNIMKTEWGLPAEPAAWAVISFASLRLGGDVTSVDPQRTITQVGDRPVLLIHGTEDVIDVPAQSAELNSQAALDAGTAVELHYCRGGTHGSLVDNPGCAADWSRWARSFLEAAVIR